MKVLGGKYEDNNDTFNPHDLKQPLVEKKNKCNRILKVVINIPPFRLKLCHFAIKKLNFGAMFLYLKRPKLGHVNEM